MLTEKIRIYALARELQEEPKDLLDLCRQAGIDVKNQLSSLDPEQRDLIVSLVKRGRLAVAPGPVRIPAPAPKESEDPSAQLAASVYFLAHALKVLPEEVLQTCKKLGIPVSKFFDSLNPDQARAVEKHFLESRTGVTTKETIAEARPTQPAAGQGKAELSAAPREAPATSPLNSPDRVTSSPIAPPEQESEQKHAKSRVSVHKIARSLGLKRDQIRQACQRLGISFQKSFTLEQRNLVVTYLRGQQGAAATPSPSTKLVEPSTAEPVATQVEERAMEPQAVASRSGPQESVPAEATVQVEDRKEAETGLPQLPIAPRDPAFSPDQIGTTYPLPIALAYQRLFWQKEDSGRLLTLFSAVEAMVKYLLSLGVCDLLQLLTREHKAVAMLQHPMLAFLCKHQEMTQGGWCAALRETARCLADVGERFVEELPEVCTPGKDFDTELRWLVEKRNKCIHPSGQLAISPIESRELYREMRPVLESTLRRVQFVCSYPLGFVQPSFDGLSEQGSWWYDFFSCMGSRITEPQDAYSGEMTVPLWEQTPFVLAPKSSKMLYLWPLLSQRVAVPTGRHCLYVFEQIPSSRKGFLAQTSSFAVDIRDERWDQTWYDKPASSHDWLIQRLQEQSLVTILPNCAEVVAWVSTPERGKLVGQTLGPYRLLRIIGSGGSATVYLAKTNENRAVAIKVLDTQDAKRHYKRFRQEFEKLQSAGQNPNIVQCFEWNTVKVEKRLYPWYSMEYALGGDLTGRIDSRRPQSGSGPVWAQPAHRGEIIKEFLAVSDAIAFLHRRNLIHRDIKPGNVLIMEDGCIRVSDFGLGKNLDPSEKTQAYGPRSETGASMGTPYYMAPEQERGLEVDKHSDVYSLGILLAELTTGYKPQPNTFILNGSTLQGEKSLHGLPSLMRKFILRCTDISPEQRPIDGQKVFEEFREIIKSLDIQLSADGY